MTVSVNRKPQESAFDKVAKGLAVAGNAFGIYSDYKNIQARNQDMAIKARAESDAQAGILSKAELLKQADSYTMADENTPGAIKYQVRDNGGLKDVYLASKSAQVKPSALTQENQVSFMSSGGQFVEPGKGARDALIQDVDGKTKVVGLIPPKPKADQIPNPNKAAFDQLAIENQEQVKKLAGSNANKISINNQLKATLETLDNPEVPYEQKLMASMNLGKTLNSTEGQDAVGADEAKRMLAFLNHMPVGRPGWDLGPQLDKFTEQVRIKTGDIDKAIASNKQAIDGFYGKQVKVAQLAPPPKKPKGDSGLFKEANAGGGSGEIAQADLDALAWVRANPKDPNAQKVRAKLMTKGLKP